MPTTKKRINVSLPEDVEEALQKAADRDHMPQATKAIGLIQRGLELEEDQLWDEIAARRDKKGAKFISHDKAWR